MGRHYQILWPLFSLFLVRVDLTDLWPMQIPVKLVKVYDGDTVLVRHKSLEMKIRLMKIDAPENGQPFINGTGDSGKMAGECLRELINREKELILKPIQRDMYGRILGEINDLSLKAIEAGCASLYPHARFDSQQEKYQFLRSLQKAKGLQKGIWKFGGFRNPKLWRKTSKRNGHRRSHPRGHSR